MAETTKEALEWAKKAYDKLKNKPDIKFRSKLEENVASLLEGLGISYEYESEKLSYVIEHRYTPDFKLPNYKYLEVKGYWDAECISFSFFTFSFTLFRFCRLSWCFLL